MSRTGKILSFLGLASLAVSVASAQSLPPSVAACAAEKDSLARLVCFDREVAKYSQPAAAVAPTPATPAAPTPPPAVAATPPAPPAAAAVVPPAAATPSHDSFGMNSEVARKRETQGTKKETPKELRASVTKVSAQPYGEVVMALDNGQVWQQNEANSVFLVKVGEGVVIKAAHMGSFMLTTAAGATTRVHRTQ